MVAMAATAAAATPAGTVGSGRTAVPATDAPMECSAAFCDPYLAAPPSHRQVAFGEDSAIGDAELADGLLDYLSEAAANAPPAAAARATALARAIFQRKAPLPPPPPPMPRPATRSPQRSALRNGAGTSPSPVSTVPYPSSIGGSPGELAAPSTPAPPATGIAALAALTPIRVDKTSPPLAKRGRTARTRRLVGSPAGTIGKRTTLRPVTTKEERDMLKGQRAAAKAAAGDLLSSASDSDFLDSLSEDDADAMAAAPDVGFHAPPLAIVAAGAPTC